MENTQLNTNNQIVRLTQFARLKNLRKNQSWLSKKIGTNKAYISQWFNHGHYSYLGTKIEKVLAKEEEKLSEQSA